MSSKLHVLCGAAAAMLTATPCFAFSVVQTPQINDYSALAKHFDAAGAHYFQDANGGPQPTARAGEHGVMVTYDLSAPTSKPQNTLGRDSIAEHPADARFNPFMGADADDVGARAATAEAGGRAQAR